MAITNGGNGNDILIGTAGNDTIHGDNGDDLLSGGGGNDQLFGDNGNDILNGEAGNDLLDGGRGDDVLTGGPGAETFVMSQGSDTITDFSPSIITPETLSFEGLLEGEVPNGYGGLNWNNVSVVIRGGPGYAGTGYANVVNSEDKIAFDPWGLPSSFSSASGDNFDLQGGYFAAAWNNDLHMSFIAYDHGNPVGDAEVDLNPTKAFIDFQHETATGVVGARFTGHFSNIDSVSITSSGGTNANLGGEGTHFAMDDLQVALRSGDGDLIQVPTAADISKLVASATSNGSGGTVLSGVPGFGTLTLDNTAPSQVQSSWFVTG